MPFPSRLHPSSAPINLKGSPNATTKEAFQVQSAS
jgi:hypothetical protein